MTDRPVGAFRYFTDQGHQVAPLLCRDPPGSTRPGLIPQAVGDTQLFQGHRLEFLPTLPPQAHRFAGDLQFPRNLAVALPGGGGKNDPRPQSELLRRGMPVHQGLQSGALGVSELDRHNRLGTTRGGHRRSPSISAVEAQEEIRQLSSS